MFRCIFYFSGSGPENIVQGNILYDFMYDFITYCRENSVVTIDYSYYYIFCFCAKFYIFINMNILVLRNIYYSFLNIKIIKVQFSLFFTQLNISIILFAIESISLVKFTALNKVLDDTVLLLHSFSVVTIYKALHFQQFHYAAFRCSETFLINL